MITDISTLKRTVLIHALELIGDHLGLFIKMSCRDILSIGTIKLPQKLQTLITSRLALPLESHLKYVGT